MGRLIIVIVIAVFIAILCLAALKMEVGWLRAWAVLATLFLLPAFVGGVIVGSLEAKGKISGIDLAMHTLGSTYDHATKTVAKLESKRPAPTVQVYNAGPNDGLPPISHRALTEGDEVIDL